MPKTMPLIEVSIPNIVAVESLDALSFPKWDAADQIASRAFGDEWLIASRSAVLKVPSAVTRGHEHNILINPGHPDFKRIVASAPQDVEWGRRLFQH
jgi:RES domain-containing protein